MDELLLWRWSTAVQITSALTIAVFFVVYGRDLSQPGFKLWVKAWVANGIALATTWLYWMIQPDGRFWMVLTVIFYMGAKTAFVALLMLGLREFLLGALKPNVMRNFLVGLFVFTTVCSALISGIDMIGSVQATVITGAMAYGTWLCWRNLERGLAWLGIGFFLRFLLGSAESASYAARAILADPDVPNVVNLFLASHSSFDTGAEWVIALGCLLAVTKHMHEELSRSHNELHAAHAELSRIAECDPLTGLYNRRMLQSLIEVPSMKRGQLLFFDLDDFKRINDALGHDGGDECLKRVARALKRSFEDAVGIVRFAGDEFVVLLPEHAQDLDGRLAALRHELAEPQASSPTIGFSVGKSELREGLTLRDLLHDADLAMYSEKRARLKKLSVLS